MKASWILFGLVVILVGLGLVFPAFAQARLPEGLQGPSVPLLGIGVILTLAGMWISLRGFRYRERPHE